MDDDAVFAVGDFVRLRVPSDRRDEAFAMGVVIGLERYVDMNGTRNWVHVRWFDGDGLPESNTKQHAKGELEMS